MTGSETPASDDAGPGKPEDSGTVNSEQDAREPPTPEEAAKRRRNVRRSAVFGAVFLMATSSIGPGFITQTSVFTVQLGAAFAFAILVSIVVDIFIQLNVWRVNGVVELRMNEHAKALDPALGGALLAAEA